MAARSLLRASRGSSYTPAEGGLSASRLPDAGRLPSGRGTKEPAVENWMEIERGEATPAAQFLVRWGLEKLESTCTPQQLSQKIDPIWEKYMLRLPSNQGNPCLPSRPQRLDLERSSRFIHFCAAVGCFCVEI
jgi:hypothetical protein